MFLFCFTSSAGEEQTVQANAQVREQAIKKVEFQVKEEVTARVDTKECALVKKETRAAAAQMDNQKSPPVKTNTPPAAPTHTVPDKTPDAKQVSEEHGSRPNTAGKAPVLKQQGGEVDMNVNKLQKANANTTNQINTEPKKTVDAKVNRREVGMMNGAVKGEGSALTNNNVTAEVSKQQVLRGSAADGKAKGSSQVEASKPPVNRLPVGHLSPPVIKLEPLNVKSTGACDEVQSMEVR